MKKAISITLGICAAGIVACAIVHRRVIKAMVKGEPLPEPPASHTWHKAAKQPE